MALRTPRRTLLVPLVVGALALVLAGSASAYWRVAGGGSGTGGTGTTAAVTLSPGTPTAGLYPGGTADVVLTVTNANASPVLLGSLVLDTSQGTGGFSADAGHSGCAVTALSLPNQTNGGSGWTVPGKVGAVNGTLSVTLSDALTMSVAAANACQGATFTVYLMVAAGTAYVDTVLADPGLVNYYRLDEALSSSGIDDLEVANNNGTYVGGPTMAQAGAIAGSSNTAVSFDGVDDYGTIARQVSGNMSIEFWFKSTQGLSLGTYWWQGAGLVDAEVSGAANDFGVSLRSDGKVLAGVGSPDVSVISSTGGYNDGAWHHVVFTRTQSTGALNLYVDGGAPDSGTGSVSALTSAPNINFARSAGGSNYYQGSLDEIAIYNTVLGSTTVTGHFNAGR